jgi:hypothetical protein
MKRRREGRMMCGWGQPETETPSLTAGWRRVLGSRVTMVTISWPPSPGYSTIATTTTHNDNMNSSVNNTRTRMCRLRAW